jgi:hypothetical protein
MTHSITTIITYCTNDHSYLAECINAVKPFSTNIILAVADKLWNGKPEDFTIQARLGMMLKDEPNIFVAGYKVLEKINPPKFYVNESKRQALLHMLQYKLEADHVLLLDCDEIIDTSKFLDYLGEGFYKNYDAIRFAAHWYFRERRYRAIQDSEVAGVLYNFNTFCDLFLINNYPKWWGLPAPGKNIINAKDRHCDKMVHHYSWVREKDAMLIKAANIGHSDDWNLVGMVMDEFEHEFNGTDFLPGHEYEYEDVG